MFDPTRVSAEQNTLAAVRPKKPRRKRNYWAHLNPAEFAPFPNFEPIPYLTEARLFRRAQSGDQVAFHEIWIRHARLAYSVANQYSIPQSLLADALQEGAFAIRRAIERYEVERYNAFSTYAWYWVYQAMGRFLQRSRYLVPIPAHLWSELHIRVKNSDAHVCAGIPIQVEAIVPFTRTMPLTSLKPEEHPTTIEPSQVPYDAALLKSLVKRILRDREHYVISHRVGLGEVDVLTLEELGKRLDVSRERIRQIETKALQRLREQLPVHGWRGLHGDEQVDSPKSTETVESLDAAQPLDHEPEPAKSRTPRDNTVDEILLSVFKCFTFRQANSLIHYYGLLRQQPLPLACVAKELDLSRRKTYLALKKGRKKLIRVLRPFSHPDLQQIQRNLVQSPITELDDESAAGLSADSESSPTPSSHG